MFRSLILAVSTIGALAIGFAVPAQAYVPCSPYVGGMCGQDTQIGLGAMIYHSLGGGGGYGGYGHPYGYRPRPYYYRPPAVIYHPPQAWCVGRDMYGNEVSRTPGPCPYGD